LPVWISCESNLLRRFVLCFVSIDARGKTRELPFVTVAVFQEQQVRRVAPALTAINKEKSRLLAQSRRRACFKDKRRNPFRKRADGLLLL